MTRCGCTKYTLLGTFACAKGFTVDIPLMRGKLLPPRLSANRVSRPRLIERLQEGFDRCPRLTLVSAPGGYGKSTLVAEWLAERGIRNGWLNLDAEDNDPVRFVTYVVAALRCAVENAGMATLNLLEAQQLPSVGLLSAVLLDDLAAGDVPYALVLDDFHLIRSDSVLQLMQPLIDRLPATVNLLIIAREDPRFPLSRLRVLEQLTEIRVRDLRFSLDEARAFFHQAVSVDLEENLLGSLETRAEGWVAGLQLAAATVRGWGTEEITALLEDFGGSNRYVVDYFAEEVLKHQTEDVRDFLYRTSILDRMCAELCDELLDRTGSREVISGLERRNLFLMPLDANQKWYRYHALFAGFLSTRLDRLQRLDLHRKAARWFERAGFPAEAVRHVILSGDVAEAERLIDMGAVLLLHESQYRTLLSWLGSLPDERLRANGELTLYKAWALFLAGEMEQAAALATELAAASDRGAAESSLGGRFLLLRGWLSDVEGREPASDIVSGALSVLPEEDWYFRALALILQGRILHRQGSAGKAHQVLEKALVLAGRAGNAFLTLAALHNQAYVLLDGGERREAERRCLAAVDRYVVGFGNPLPLNALVYVPLAAAYYWANDLKRAEEYAGKAHAVCRRLGVSYLLMDDGSAVLSATRYADGDTEGAVAMLRDAVRSDRRSFPRMTRTLAALRAHMELRRGNIAAALRWEEELDSPTVDPSREVEYTVLARVLLAQSRPEEALSRLRQLRDSARSAGRFGILVSLRVLEAVAAEASGDTMAAAEAMEEAVALAHAEDYRRAFLDEGRDVAQVLSNARPVAPAFVDSVLEAFAKQDRDEGGTACGSAANSARPHATEDLLSARENEVLKLIAEGLSNKQIADVLYISVGTVKWHVNNILGKLTARSRTQAVARARELRMLQ